MSSKWNERLVISFLKVYKHHPCLWNPYHKDYYNCHVKNKALRSIIKDLSIPGVTVTDYLRQIKSIREKYKQEQIRTIKSLQARKQYISPFPWYHIVAEMLTKVISDEEKAGQQDTAPVFRSLNSNNVKDSQTKDKTRTNQSAEKPFHLNRTHSSVREKTNKRVRYDPCLQFRCKGDGSREQTEDMISHYRPTKDTDYGILEYPVPSTSMDSRYNDTSFLTRRNDTPHELSFLKCPFCGWEDAKHKEIEKYEARCDPCSAYNRDLSGAIYSTCTECEKVTRDDLSYQSTGITNLPEYSKKHTDSSGDFDILHSLTNQVPDKSSLLENFSEMENTGKHSEEASKDDYAALTSTQTKYDQSKETLKSDIPVSTSMQTQYDEHSKETLKNILVPVSIQTQVMQTDPAIVNKLQCGTIEASIQLKIILLDPNITSENNGFVTEDASRSTKLLQGTKPTSTKETQLSPGYYVPESKKYETSIDPITYAEKQMQDTVHTSDEINQTLDQTDQKEEKGDEQRKISVDSKEVSVNMVDQVTKRIQSIINVSRGNSAYRMSPEKMVETGTAMSLHKIHSVGCMTTKDVKQFKSNFVQCVQKENFPDLIRSRSHDSIKCCVRDTDLKYHLNKRTQEYEAPCTTDTCLLNILHIIRENPDIASILQQLLRNMLCECECDEHETQSAKLDRQINRNCMTDTTEIVNTIKKYTRKLFQEVKSVSSFEDVGTSISRDNKLTMTEKSIFEPVFQSTVKRKDKGQRITEDMLSLRKVDKKVCIQSDCRDIGINGSTQSSIRDIESSSEMSKDSVSITKYEKDIEEKVSVGTQKRDPILVQMIKCNKCQPVVRSDKETLTMGTDVGLEKKLVETCNRFTCIPPTVCRKSNVINFDSGFHKNHENQIVNNYCKHSVVFKDDICDKNCKSKMSYDWTDVTNIDVFSNITNSKIPMYIRKDPYARSK